MPHQVKRTHTYWCPGGWPWEWLDTCTREFLYWQYDFDWVHRTSYGIVRYLEGCEEGQLFTWYEPCFLEFGSQTTFKVTDFFSAKKSSRGPCSEAGAGSIASPLGMLVLSIGRLKPVVRFIGRLYALRRFVADSNAHRNVARSGCIDCAHNTNTQDAPPSASVEQRQVADPDVT
jgi:hypothetical protein